MVTMFAIWLFVTPQKPVNLPQITGNINQEYLQLTRTSLLVRQSREILEIDFEGKLVNKYKAEVGQTVDNFSYIKHLDMVVLVTSTEPDHNSHSIRIYYRGDSGNPIKGFAYDLGQYENYFRQLLTTNSGRMFVNLWGLKNTTKDTPLLVEVELNHCRDGLLFERADNLPFHEQVKAAEHQPSKFMLRWLCEDGEDLLVLNQTQPYVRRYSAVAGKRGQLREKADILSFSDWIAPLKKRPDPQAPTKEYIDEYRKWEHSLSTTTGIWAFEGGFLISYKSPNKKHPDYGDDDEYTERDTSRFTLNCIAIYPDGNMKPRPVLKEPIPGGFVAGVLEDTIYIVQQNGPLYSLQRF